MGRTRTLSHSTSVSHLSQVLWCLYPHPNFIVLLLQHGGIRMAVTFPSASVLYDLTRPPRRWTSGLFAECLDSSMYLSALTVAYCCHFVCRDSVLLTVVILLTRWFMNLPLTLTKSRMGSISIHHRPSSYHPRWLTMSSSSIYSIIPLRSQALAPSKK